MMMRGNLHAWQAVSACLLLVVCAVLQPRHKEVALLQRHAGARALAHDDRQSRATLQALTADSANSWGEGGMDDDEDAPPPEDIMAIQGAQAGSIMGLDYMEASAAATAASAVAAAPELIPLMALRQRYPQRRGLGRPQLRTVDAPFRLSGYTVPGSAYDRTQPSADPWTGDPSLARVVTNGQQGQAPSRASAATPSSGISEADYGRARSAAQAGQAAAARGQKPQGKKAAHGSIRLPAPRALYEYHVPGDYLGGDGGMDSDYDDVIAPSEFYGLDQKVCASTPTRAPAPTHAPSPSAVRAYVLHTLRCTRARIDRPTDMHSLDGAAGQLA